MPPSLFECANQMYGSSCYPHQTPHSNIPAVRMDVDVGLQHWPLIEFTLRDDRVSLKCQGDPRDVAVQTCEVTPATSCTSEWSMCQLKPGDDVHVRSSVSETESGPECNKTTTRVSISRPGREPLLEYNSRDCCNDKELRVIDRLLPGTCDKGPSSMCHDSAIAILNQVEGGCLARSKYKDAVCRSNPTGDIQRQCCRIDSKYCHAGTARSLGDEVGDVLAVDTIPRAAELGLATIGALHFRDRVAEGVTRRVQAAGGLSELRGKGLRKIQGVTTVLARHSSEAVNAVEAARRGTETETQNQTLRDEARTDESRTSEHSEHTRGAFA